MAPIDPKPEFLAKAKEAEGRADEAKSESDKASWLRIAAGYHDLASKQTGKKD